MKTLHRPAWVLAAACAMCASGAQAQEAREGHFDGVYVGVAGGAAFQQRDDGNRLAFDRNGDGTYDDTVRTAAGANAFGPGFCSGRARTTAPSGGCDHQDYVFDYAARIGIDKRVGRNIVVGALFEANRSNARQEVTGYSTTPATYTLSRKLDYGLALRGRAGFTPNGGMLLYGTGGVTYSHIKHDFITTNTTNSFDEGRDKMVWGWQAGGGGEVMLTDHVSLGLEYLYSRYRDTKYTVEVAQGSAPATNPFVLGGGGTSIRPSNKNFDVQAIRGTLNFQF